MPAEPATRAAPPPHLVSYVLDPLERAGTTFVQQFVNYLLATGSAGLLVSQDWGGAADTAGFAAIISVLLSLATFKIKALSPGVDLILRVVRTFVSSVIATLTAGHAAHSVVHADWQGAVALALPVALTAALKGLAALAVSQTRDASLIPAAWYSSTAPTPQPAVA